MASSYEDTVFDFDLDFLHTGNKTVNNKGDDKHHKSVLMLKSKVVATEDIIFKYYTKKIALEQTKKTVDAFKKKKEDICMEYVIILDKCGKLEQDIQTLLGKNEELDAKYIASENRYGAIQSHSNQLQQLLKKQELNIEALKIESQLEKNNVKNLEKIISFLKKEINDLKKHIKIISDVTSRKKKITEKHKIILKKYNIIIGDKPCIEPLSGEGNSGDEANIFDDFSMSPSIEDYSERNNAQIQIIGEFDLNPKNLNGNNHEEKGIDQDSDCIHEIVSVDTGRGSSLAFSDSDKCFHSPDYFSNDSPISTETRGSKDHRGTISIGTSPVIFTAHIDASTSPIDFEQCEYPIVRSNLKNDRRCPVPAIVIDEVTAIDFSPIKEITPVNATVQNKSNECEINLKEKECLELNNSINLHMDSRYDSEIQTILNVVRLPHDMITPLPSTPEKSRGSVGKYSSTSSLCNEQIKLLCQGAANVWEENRVISENLDLSKNEIHKRKLRKTSLNIESSPDERNLSNVDSIGENIPKPKTSQIMQFQEPSAAPTQNEELLADHISSACAKSSSVLNRSLNLLFEEEPELNDDSIEQDSVEKELTSGMTENKKKTKAKKIKLTKLEKMRKKMIPKGKIQRIKTPSFKKVVLPKPKQLLPLKKQVANTDYSATLNDKDIYAKAVKVMSELNKQKSENNRNLSKCTFTQATNDDGNNISCQKTESHRMNSSSSKSSITTRRRLSAQAKGNNIPCEELKTNSAQPSPLKITTTSSSITTRRCASTQAKGADCNISCEATESYRVNSSTTRSYINTRRRVSTQAKGNNIPCEEVESHHIDPTPFKGSIITRRRPSTQAKGADGNNIPCEKVESIRVHPSSYSSSVTTRSRSKRASCSNDEENLDDSNVQIQETCKKPPKRTSLEKTEIENKRRLRSSNRKELVATTGIHLPCDVQTLSKSQMNAQNELKCQEINVSVEHNPQENILFKMIEKHGVLHIKYSSKNPSDSIISSYAKKIEEGIAQIAELPSNDVNKGMQELVERIKRWPLRHFLRGLTKYLMDPARKVELFSKVPTPHGPDMTKSEHILLYVVMKLKISDNDVTNCILSNIEYTLFRLNRTPDFDTIESMSHFYAVLCRHGGTVSRLRIFILDSMYCLQFKAVPLIKQCLDVWPSVLPLGHMRLAKSPLVICLVYLLHFFKCEDKFNRVQTLRNIIKKQFFFNISDWNESKILEMFRTSIMELRDVQVEVKMLRIGLIILAKRLGARWCQNNIFKNLLQPIIEKEGVPENVKEFCVSMMGPLLKPYPADMKVHCEIVMNQLIDMWNSNPTQRMQEVIMTSLIYMNKHNQSRVIQLLVSWSPEKISPEMEETLKKYVREKPFNVWKTILTKMSPIDGV